MLFISLCGGGMAYGGEASTIALRDGSTINGEVLSMHDGVYTIRSETLGTIAVKQSDIRTLTNGAAVPAPSAAQGQMDAVAARMAADPAVMDAVTALQDSPDVQAVLDDPDLMRAVQSGDLETLLTNPKLAHLAADPRVQDITKKLDH